MEDAALATPVTLDNDELLTASKQKSMEPHALRQDAVLSFGRRTNAQPPLAVLMQDAATVVGEVLSAPFGGVAELRGDTLVVSVYAMGSQGAQPRQHRCAMSDDESMAAFAMRAGSATVSADLRRETRFRDGFLRSLNVIGAITVPLHVNGKPFGALAVYADNSREFTVDDVAFAETIAHLLSASVARIRAEEELQEAHEVKSSLLGMVDSMVMTLDMDGRVVDMNRACESLTQFNIDDVRDRPFWQAMVSPDEADLVKLIFQSSRGSQIPSEFEGEVVARDGTRRRVSWSLKVLSTGQVQSILVTGRDQTAQVELKAELQRMKSLAEETTATLNQISARLEKTQIASAPSPGARTTAAEPRSAMPPTESEMSSIAIVPTNQRRSPRRAYRCRQNIVPVAEDGSSMQGPFLEVDCWDISACGFSFFMEQLPKFDMLIAALGRQGELTHFSARVMRVARMNQNDRIRYLVGCDFVERVKLAKARV